MRTIGFLISHKAQEGRRAILPQQIKKKVRNPQQLFFETGYGLSVGVEDIEYEKVGSNVVNREEALECDVIIDVKLGDADYLDSINKKVLFGWAHAVQGIKFTTSAIKGRHTVIAWEEIYEKGRYIFYRNREVAGEAAVLQAFRYCGKMPYDCSVAILGNGQTAKGALRVLHGLGAKVDVYGKRLESLFREKMYSYVVLINCILWDTSRTDRIIYREDLRKMKKGTLIIDVSCDPHLEIETSHPTTIDDPTYTVDGVVHYVVDNTPAMYPATVSKVLSEGIANYIDMLIESPVDSMKKSIVDAIVIKDGEIIDNRIKEFRARIDMEE